MKSSISVLLVAVLLVMTGLSRSAAPAPEVQAQAGRGPFTVISSAGRRALIATTVNDHDMVSLDDLAALLQLSLREDALAGGMTVGYKGRSVVVMADQAIASVGGKLVSLPAPVVKENRRWLVPVEFVPRALGLIHDVRLDYRPASRLLVLGDLRVPRVNVRYEAQGNQVRLTFDASPRTSSNVTQDQNRLLVHFEADALDTALPSVGAMGLADAIRVVEPGNTVAITLGSRFASYRAATSSPDPNSARLVLDLLPALPATGPAPAAPPVAVPVPELPPPAAAGGLRTIAIDPGHGGEERGARGPSGVVEKDVTLGVARRLKGLIESRLGLRAFLTREGDGAVALDDRAALANNNKADLFISLHANAARGESIKGAEVFYLAPEGYAQPPAPAASNLPTYGGGSRDIGVVMWDVAQMQHLGESAALAALVEEELRARVPMSAQPVQQAPMRVLVGANMPAVLVEMGFLSNAEQEQALAAGPFQDTVAQALFAAVVRFGNTLGRGRVTSQPAVAPTGREMERR